MAIAHNRSGLIFDTERIVSLEIRRLRSGEADVEKYGNGDRRKVRVARRLRQETIMALNWIAGRLKMEKWHHVTNRLYHVKN